MSIIYCLLDGVGLTDQPAPPWTSAALLTGINAAALLGSHQPAFPTATLRRAIEEHSLLRQVVALGRRPLMATAYPQHYWELADARKLRPTAGALASRAAGLALPSLPELRQERALPWDITGEYLWRRRPELADLPVIAPDEAGRRLALLAYEYDLIFYECYLPDFVGHRRIAIPHEVPLELADRFLDGLLAARRPGDTLVVVSDHGNLEEPDHRQHTRNPVPLCVIGPAAPWFADLRGIEDVATAILRFLRDQ